MGQLHKLEVCAVMWFLWL